MTITPSSLGAALTFFVVFAAVFAGVTLWRRRIPGLGFGPSARAALYLSRYAMALEYYGLRRSEITAHVDDLRGDLAAADPVDVDGTLQRLGPPRTLAAEVTSGLLRPSLLRGSIWLGVGALLGFALSVLTTEAFLAGFEDVAEPGQKATWSFVGFGAEATMGTGGHASSIGFGGTWLVLLPLMAFVIGARLWRLTSWARRRSPSEAT